MQRKKRRGLQMQMPGASGRRSSLERSQEDWSFANGSSSRKCGDSEHQLDWMRSWRLSLDSKVDKLFSCVPWRAYDEVDMCDAAAYCVE
eukprot:600679-Amphidinium_carterae.1